MAFPGLVLPAFDKGDILSVKWMTANSYFCSLCVGFSSLVQREKPHLFILTFLRHHSLLLTLTLLQRLFCFLVTMSIIAGANIDDLCSLGLGHRS